jgi:homoserine kinase
VRAGFIGCLSELTGAKLSRQQLLELVTELEGHPDNASPALFGGFTVSGEVNHSVRCLSFPVSGRLKCVTLIPQFGISTEKARSLLPLSYTRADTAHTLNRAALISGAFSSGNYEALRGLFDDRVHQPYRQKLNPQLLQVIRAGEGAGAVGGFLSGSGSAIVCLALKEPERVARAMKRVLPASEIRILSPANEGLKVLRR